LQQFLGNRLHLAGRLALQQPGQRHVLQCRHGRQQMKELKNDPDRVAPVIGQKAIVRRVQWQSIHEQFSAARRIQSPEQVEKRALAASARSGDRHEFPRCNFKRNAVERRDTVVVSAMKIAGLDDWIRHSQGGLAS
jgi:hypothetical protein